MRFSTATAWKFDTSAERLGNVTVATSEARARTPAPPASAPPHTGRAHRRDARAHPRRGGREHRRGRLRHGRPPARSRGARASPGAPCSITSATRTASSRRCSSSRSRTSRSVSPTCPPTRRSMRASTLFVQRAWEHFASPHFRSTLEILLHTSPEPREGESGWQGEMVQAFNRIWQRLFADAGFPRAALRRSSATSPSVLTGLSALDRLDGRGHARSAELALLEETLLRELGPERLAAAARALHAALRLRLWRSALRERAAAPVARRDLVARDLLSWASISARRSCIAMPSDDPRTTTIILRRAPRPEPGRRRGALGADPRTRPGVCGPTRRRRRLVPRDRLRLLGHPDPGLPGPRRSASGRPTRARGSSGGTSSDRAFARASRRRGVAPLASTSGTSPLSSPRAPSTMRSGSAPRSPGVRTDPLPSLGRLAARDEASLPGRRGPGALRRRSLRRGAPSRRARGRAGLRVRRRVRRRLRVEPGRAPHARARARRARRLPRARLPAAGQPRPARRRVDLPPGRPSASTRPRSCTCSRTRGPSPAAPGVELVGAPWRSKRPAARSGRRGLRRRSRPRAGATRVCVAHGARRRAARPIATTRRASRSPPPRPRSRTAASTTWRSATATRAREVGASGRVYYAGTPEPTDFDEVLPGEALVVDARRAGASRSTPHARRHLALRAPPRPAARRRRRSRRAREPGCRRCPPRSAARCASSARRARPARRRAPRRAARARARSVRRPRALESGSRGAAGRRRLRGPRARGLRRARARRRCARRRAPAATGAGPRATRWRCSCASPARRAPHEDPAPAPAQLPRRARARAALRAARRHGRARPERGRQVEPGRGDRPRLRGARQRRQAARARRSSRSTATPAARSRSRSRRARISSRSRSASTARRRRTCAVERPRVGGPDRPRGPRSACRRSSTRRSTASCGARCASSRGAASSRSRWQGQPALASALDRAAGLAGAGAREETLLEAVRAEYQRYYTPTGRERRELEAQARELARAAPDRRRAGRSAGRARARRRARRRRCGTARPALEAEAAASEQALRACEAAAARSEGLREALATARARRDAAAAEERQASQESRARGQLLAARAAREADAAQRAEEIESAEPELLAARAEADHAAGAHAAARGRARGAAVARRARRAQLELRCAREAELARLRQRASARSRVARGEEDAARARALAALPIDPERAEAIRGAERAAQRARDRLEAEEPRVRSRRTPTLEAIVDGRSRAARAGECLRAARGRLAARCRCPASPTSAWWPARARRRCASSSRRRETRWRTLCVDAGVEDHAGALRALAGATSAARRARARRGERARASCSAGETAEALARAQRSADRAGRALGAERARRTPSRLRRRRRRGRGQRARRGRARAARARATSRRRRRAREAAAGARAHAARAARAARRRCASRSRARRFADLEARLATARAECPDEELGAPPRGARRRARARSSRRRARPRACSRHPTRSRRRHELAAARAAGARRARALRACRDEQIELATRLEVRGEQGLFEQREETLRRAAARRARGRAASAGAPTPRACSTTRSRPSARRASAPTRVRCARASRRSAARSSAPTSRSSSTRRCASRRARRAASCWPSSSSRRARASRSRCSRGSPARRSSPRTAARRCCSTTRSATAIRSASPGSGARSSRRRPPLPDPRADLRPRALPPRRGRAACVELSALRWARERAKPQPGVQAEREARGRRAPHAHVFLLRHGEPDWSPGGGPSVQRSRADALRPRAGARGGGAAGAAAHRRHLREPVPARARDGRAAGGARPASTPVVVDGLAEIGVARRRGSRRRTWTATSSRPRAVRSTSTGRAGRGAESFRDFHARVTAALGDLLGRHGLAPAARARLHASGTRERARRTS